MLFEMAYDYFDPDRRRMTAIANNRHWRFVVTLEHAILGRPLDRSRCGLVIDRDILTQVAKYPSGPSLPGNPSPGYVRVMSLVGQLSMPLASPVQTLVANVTHSPVFCTT